MKKQYTDEFKLEVVRKVLKEQHSTNQIAAEYSVYPSSSIAGVTKHWPRCSWPSLITKPSKSLNFSVLTNNTDQLHQQISKLTTELEWVKKS